MATLEQLQSKNLPFATCESIGIEIPEDCEDRSQAESLIAEIDEYLKAFALGNRCPKCDHVLDGLLGSFTWGLANGEGHCCKCRYPCRAYHRNVGAIEFLEQILAYHPSVLSQREQVTTVGR